MALLLPDPCDSACPDEFKRRARNILPRVQGSTMGQSDEQLQSELLRFIGDFANWGNSSKPPYVEAARALVKAAYGDESPLVIDPFAGGGAIPLEALRLGCDTYASDLNPVATLILKATLQDIPRLDKSFAIELREAGERIRADVERELSGLYPATENRKPIAYLWARTVVCDSCGTEIPLVRSFWLSKKNNRKRALRYKITRGKGTRASIDLEIFEPQKDSDLSKGTMTKGKATCLACHVVMPAERVKAQLRLSRGGSDVELDANGQRTGGARLMVVVTLDEKGTGRAYRLASSDDYRAILVAREILAKIQSREGQTPLDELVNPIRPSPNARGLSAVTRFGVVSFGDLFTARQKAALLVLSDHVRRNAEAPNGNQAVARILALSVSKIAELLNTQSRWEPIAECPHGAFSRQSLAATWDFSEAVLTSHSSGSYATSLANIVRSVESLCGYSCVAGQVEQSSASHLGLPDASADIWFTDPPYYDAIPYADLSDFFFVWLKRCLPPRLLPHAVPLEGGLTPKKEECVWNQAYDGFTGQKKTPEFFEKCVSKSFDEARRVLSSDGIGCVVFAHKTTEGWEALLKGMLDAQLVINGSWPITTEMAHKVGAGTKAMLLASVHLVCRPRSTAAPIGDWADVLRELPHRVGNWIERLQAEGVRGADLVFACIGPAMEIYSRYRSVEDAEGREIPLGGDPLASEPFKRGFLSYVWETVGRLALEEILGTAEARARNGAAGALEEDSRLTALFLWTLQTTEADSADAEQSNADDELEEDEDEDKPQRKRGGYTLIFDVARRFAQPLGIHLDKWKGRIIETEKGIVRLLPVAERASQLFGEADAAAISRRIEADVKASRNYSFAFMQDVGTAPEIKTRGRGRKADPKSAAVADLPAPQPVTTLDRVHAAMLLQRGGQTNGLRALLREETQRGPDFLRLANALTRLYPKDSEEKRLLDAMSLALPRN
jgi:putative DNA methylase